MKTLKIKSIFSTILCVIWISGLSAQSLTVTGTVTDENNRASYRSKCFDRKKPERNSNKRTRKIFDRSDTR